MTTSGWHRTTLALLLLQIVEPCLGYNPTNKVTAQAGVSSSGVKSSRMLSPGKDDFRGTKLAGLDLGGEEDEGNGSEQDGRNNNANAGRFAGNLIGVPVSASSHGQSAEIHRGQDNFDLTMTTEEEEEEVVQLVLSLEMPESSIPQEPATLVRQGDLETWVCYLDALVTEKLAVTSSRSHVVVLVVQPNAMAAFSGGGSPTITLDVVSSNDPDELLADLQQTLTANAINEWMQKDLPASNALYSATIVDWGHSLAQATIASNPLESRFSTADCGTARVSMTFGFFEDDLTLTDQVPDMLLKYDNDIKNLMCSTSDFYTMVFGALEEGSGVTVTMDHVHWELDLSATNPLMIEFDMQATEPGTGRKMPPVALLEWMAQSDMHYYIQEAVWTSLPYETSIFHHANGVFFDGKVRPLNQEAPMRVMSTQDCVDGFYAPEDTAANRDESILELTSWTLHFGFEDGFKPVEPTSEEVEGLFCQTFFYFKDIFRPDLTTPYNPIVYTNLTMQAYEYSFNPFDDKPFVLHLDAQAWFPRGAQVNPEVLRGKLEQNWNISTYITDYVWNSEPEDNNVMSHVFRVHTEGGVLERHVAIPMEFHSNMCVRETLPPSEMPTDAPNNEPTEAPTRSAEPTREPTTEDGNNEGPLLGGGIGGIGSLVGGGGGIGGDIRGESPFNGAANGGTNNGPQEIGGGGRVERPPELVQEGSGYAELGSGAIRGESPFNGAANGGTNNGPQEIGGGGRAERPPELVQEGSGYAELSSSALENRPPADGTYAQVDEEDRGSTGGVEGGIGGLGGGIGGMIGRPGGSVIQHGNNDGTITVPVDTSFVAIHLPNVPVSDGSDHVNDALADMLQDMISSKPRPGAEPPERRQLATETELDYDSIQTGNITVADCTHYYDVDAYADNMECSRVEGRFDVIVTGAEKEEELEAVKADYKNLAATGIENGMLQESLNEVAPDSGLLVVSDREEQHPIEDGTEPPPATDATEEEQVPVVHAPEPEQPTKAPQSSNTQLPKQEKDHEGIKDLPLWGMILLMLLLFALGIVTGLNLQYFCCQKQKRGHQIDDADEMPLALETDRF